MNEREIFVDARRIASATVAHGAGLALKRRGSREWTCCPFHQENTPSLCFFPDGGWYCFGCHRGGTSVDFYSALYGVPPFEAAKALAGERNLPRTIKRNNAAPPPRRTFLAGRDEDGFTWGDLCGVLHKAEAVIEAENADTPRLWEALAARTEAEIKLENWLAGEVDAQAMEAFERREVKDGEQQRRHST